jgi:hypothetical protein
MCIFACIFKNTKYKFKTVIKVGDRGWKWDGTRKGVEKIGMEVRLLSL